MVAAYGRLFVNQNTRACIAPLTFRSTSRVTWFADNADNLIRVDGIDFVTNQFDLNLPVSTGDAKII